jgi:hypothetical protein
MKDNIEHLRFKVFNGKKYLYVYIVARFRLNFKHQIIHIQY